MEYNRRSCRFFARSASGILAEKYLIRDELTETLIMEYILQMHQNNYSRWNNILKRATVSYENCIQSNIYRIFIS